MEQAPRPGENDQQDWHTYWLAQEQPWRREPEISPARQAYLERLRAGVPPMNAASEDERTIVPFAGVALARADIEWLLATHEDQGITGPVLWDDERHQHRLSIDVRGADLRGIDLSGLPLVRWVAGPDRVVMRSADEVYLAAAEVLMDGADLRDALLDGASMRAAHLAGANLSSASLCAAVLVNAELGGANLAHTTLDKANLMWSKLDGANLEAAHGTGVRLAEVSCERVTARHVALIQSEAEGSTWTGADLTDATLERTDFTRATLRGANLTRAKLQHATLRYAVLEEATLTDAHLEHADLYETWLAGARLGGANAYGVDVDLVHWEPKSAPTVIASTSKSSNSGHSTASVGVEQRPLEEAHRAPSRPSADAAPAMWWAYWQALHQSWRREPEISAERQAYFATRRAIPPDIRAGTYPFKDVEPKLTRADIEWLLATHESQGVVGPVDPPQTSFLNWGTVVSPTRRYDHRIGPDLRGAGLRGVDLSGLPLSSLRAGLDVNETGGIGLSIDEMKLAEEAASLQLQGANLRGASLDSALLTRAHCEDCDLAGASLRQCHLNAANLNGARLTGALFERADFEHASFLHAHLDDARGNGANFQLATLDGVEAQGADLSGASLSHLTLHEVHLDRARLENADLVQIVVEGGSLAQATLDGARLRGARLDAGQLAGASMRRVDLRCSEQGNRRIAASLKNADLRLVALEAAVLENTECTGADLSGADLSRAQLEGVQFTGASLDHARLLEAQMRRVRFAGASLAGIDLRRSVCDPRTTFAGARFGRGPANAPRVAGVRWNDADLGDVAWSALTCLGDEVEARQATTAGGGRKSTEQRLAELDEASRANQQLALALAAQGLEEANRFAYRAQTLERQLFLRRILWQRTMRPLGAYLFSALLGLMTGYGHRMGRLLMAYVLLVSLAAAMDVAAGMRVNEPLTWANAYLVSITAFHGRVFFQNFSPASPLSWIAAVEGVVGLVVEGIFVAMLTQRFFRN